MLCNIMSVFTVTFDQINASLVHKCIILKKNDYIILLFKKRTSPQTFEW